MNLDCLLNCMSARSAPQIFSIEGDCTFLLWNFLINGLCNSFTSSLLEIVSSLIPLLGNPNIFYQKKLWTLEASRRWYPPSYFVFLAILNILSCNSLSEAVLLDKNLKSS